MKTPKLFDVAEEINLRSSEHPIGKLQEIRGYRPGVALFRLNGNTTQEGWACHWGGRTELQFNIGFEDDGAFLRYGVAFSLQESRVYKADVLLKKLKPKIAAYNKFIHRYPKAYADMSMWAWDNAAHAIVYDNKVAAIQNKLIKEGLFIFAGKYQPTHKINYERILSDFDRLLPLYQFVEGHSKRIPHSLSLETHFAFRPGCRTKKRSAVVRKNREQLELDLRHNRLQSALHRRLAKEYGTENVGTEVQGTNGTSIDVVVKDKKRYWFYEIKTASTARACIREALGQILEYAFWPGAQEAIRLVIVGECPIDKDGEAYLRCLRNRFSLPIEYERITVK